MCRLRELSEDEENEIYRFFKVSKLTVYRIASFHAGI